MNIQDKRIVIGIDSDSADEAIENGFARRIYNCRVNIVNGGNDGVVVPVLGNQEVINNLPDGTNKTVGAYSDIVSNTVFYFNQNSNHKDGIYRFDGTSFNQVLIGDLGWTTTTDIHSISLINNLLTWTEGLDKYPRQVDVNKLYVDPIEFDISYIKTPPTFPLDIKFQNKETAKGQNFYTKNNYYFIYRFGYENGQQSTWSPYSRLVSSYYGSFDQKDYTSVTFKINELRVFREGGIDGLYYHNHIKYIDFAYSNTYLGPFKLFKRTQVAGVVTQAGWDQLITTDTDLSLYGSNEDLEVTFRNDLTFSVIAQTDTSRPYDEIWPCETVVAVDSLNVIGNTVEGLPAFNFQIGNVSQGFKSNPDLIVPVSSGTTTGPSVSDIVGNFMVWKNYSTYGLGVVFYNEFGQKSGVYTNQKLKINTPADYRQDSLDSVWTFNFTLVGPPPPWATHYQVVRTGNNKTTRFVQGLLNNTEYVSKYEDGVPVIIPKIIGTSYGRRFPNPDRVLDVMDATGLHEGEGHTYPYQPIYEGGLSAIGLPLSTRRFDVLLINYNYHDESNWPGRPDSIPFNYQTEQIYIIGRTDGKVMGDDFPSADVCIYIGGKNRRGEKITQYSSTTNLQVAVDILIDIFNWDNQTQFEENESNSPSPIARKVYNPSSETPYIYEPGDILNVYYDTNGKYIGLIDIPITGFIGGRYLKVKFDKRFLDTKVLGPGFFIEITTPNTGANSILFYEYGDCYPIINPKTSTASYSKIDFSISEGDTHYMTFAELYSTDFRINYRTLTNNQYSVGGGYDNYPFFSMTPDPKKRNGIWETANGRPSVVLLDGEQSTQKKSTLRYSDSYINGSTINGTSTFYSFNQLQIDYTWGAIRKITSMEDILLVNCEQEAGLVYVNKSLLTSAEGANSLIISEKTLNSPKKLPGGYGCINPESVSKYNEYIYFYSKLKGCALRYNTFNGVFDISGSYKARSYFYGKESNKCQAGFDPIYRTQYFCFDDETIGFIDPKGQDYPNTWAGFFSYLPEKLAYIQLQLYTFKNGKLYKHEAGPTNTFYGTKYPSKIEMVFNAEPNYQKIFNFISQESDKALLCPVISSQEGQTTDIQEFEIINKDWQADVPGDTSYGVSKWEGDLLSSHLLKVTFQWDKAEPFRLRYLNLYSQISKRTNEPTATRK